jgi:xanthine dehydrogenase accessory factor
MSVQLNARMSELLTQRVPFVHATVVRAQDPTSARAGDAAIVLADGTIEGFVGGQCAETSVRTAALGALQDGRTVLLRVLPDDTAPFPDSPGATVVVNECLSGGALEIFLQPMLPAPLIEVVGRTPVAEAVLAIAGILDYATARSVPTSSASPASSGPGSGRRPGWISAPGPRPRWRCRSWPRWCRRCARPTARCCR